MRWHILRTLVHKELLRLVADRGGIALALLLVALSLLLKLYRNSDPQASRLTGGVEKCYVDFWEDGPWIEHLRQNVPQELRERIEIRPVTQAWHDARGRIIYPMNTGAIQLRVLAYTDNGPRYLAWFWYPETNPDAIAPFEAWFWKETRSYRENVVASALEKTSPQVRAAVPALDVSEYRSPFKGGTLDLRAGIATGLVLFSLFFTCVYLLPSMTCEERERGVLLAQMLSPATAAEILAAKFFTYPILGIMLAAVLGGLYRPVVLAEPFFWLALSAAAFGSMGIGLCIASLARTQRLASMGALCYLLMIALLQLIVWLNDIPFISWLLIEYHTPRMLHAALSRDIEWYHWFNLLGTGFLACCWSSLAATLFRARGWQ